MRVNSRVKIIPVICEIEWRQEAIICHISCINATTDISIINNINFEIKENLSLITAVCKFTRGLTKDAMEAIYVGGSRAGSNIRGRRYGVEIYSSEKLKNYEAYIALGAMVRG